MKLVSIIMPIYNGAEHMRNAIESCLAQSYENIEIIIVDDGSTDNSLKIATEYANIDNRIVIHSQENKGQASARNTGLTLANGEYIQFLDCDDTLDKECIRISIDTFKKYPDADFILFGFNVYTGTRLLRRPNPGNGVYTPGDCFSDFTTIQKLMPSPCNKLYKKAYISCSFPEDRHFAEDTIFNYQLLSEHTTIGYIGDCLYNVQLGTTNSVNKRYRQGKLLDYLFAAELIEEKLSALFAGDFDVVNYRVLELSTICYLISNMASNTTRDIIKSEIDSILHTTYFQNLMQYAKKMKLVNKHLCHLVSRKKYTWIRLHGWARMEIHYINQFLQEQKL